MGSGIGVFEDHEIEDLTDDEKKQLREEIMQELKSRRVLKQYLESNPNIRNQLRNEVANKFGRSKLKL